MCSTTPLMLPVEIQYYLSFTKVKIHKLYHNMKVSKKKNFCGKFMNNDTKDREGI